MAALEIDKLRKTYRLPGGDVRPVIDIERFMLDAGQQVALVGGSGGGKTTLLHLVAGVLVPDSGRIRVVDGELTAMSEARRDRHRARHIGYVFQTFNLLQGYSALENVRLAMMFGRGRDDARARQLLEAVGLGNRLHDRPDQLSVGQQQRVAVARALANTPALVLADEPTGNLDPTTARQSLGLMQDLCREHQAALLMVTHDASLLDRFDSVVELDSLNRVAQEVA